MPGFFGFFNFDKPGPGVPENAPPKPGIIIFFAVYFRKFWHLVKLNILFFLFNLPALVILPFVLEIYFPGTLSGGNIGSRLAYFFLGAVFLGIPVVTVGPAQAGFTYVLRNFAREQHAFLWDDFKDHGLKNLKQSMVVCLIDFLVLLIMGVDFNFYLHFNKTGLLMSLVTGVSLILFVLFIMMHLYLYPMLVTFELSTLQLYRNAFIFAVTNFFPNFGVIVISIALAVLPLLVFPVGGTLLLFLITFSTIGLITNSYAYPKLVKYMIKPSKGSDN